MNVNDGKRFQSLSASTPQSPARMLNDHDDLSTELLKRLVTDLRTVTDFSTKVLNRFVGSICSYETSEVFLDGGTFRNL